jgi:hypothetical protein
LPFIIYFRHFRDIFAAAEPFFAAIGSISFERHIIFSSYCRHLHFSYYAILFRFDFHFHFSLHFSYFLSPIIFGLIIDDIFSIRHFHAIDASFDTPIIDAIITFTLMPFSFRRLLPLFHYYALPRFTLIFFTPFLADSLLLPVSLIIYRHFLLPLIFTPFHDIASLPSAFSPFSPLRHYYFLSSPLIPFRQDCQMLIFAASCHFATPPASPPCHILRFLIAAA